MPDAVEEAADSFNLIDQPWVQVRYLDGKVAEVSLTQAFHEAEKIAQLVGELPTQGFAIFRLLLAILYRSLDEDFSSEQDWQELWQSGLPLKEIDSYLDRFRDRFDLLHSEEPFFQVADLHTEKNEDKEIALLVFDVPANNRLFTTRAGSGLERLSFAEASRWLINTQAFDYSGIKSGAVGDPRVKNGKGYGIGVGLAGRLGGVMIEGRNLRETLLLNLVVPAEREANDPDDLPPWEKPHFGPAEEVEGRLPTGPVDLYTWQSRRVRLFFDSDSVVRCLVSNGDKIATLDLFGEEPMTAWRRSPSQERTLGRTPIYTPRPHNPSRLFWRGISALLPKKSQAASANDPENTIPPGVISWISSLLNLGYLDRNSFVSLRAIGVLYPDQNNSTVGEVLDDRLNVSLALLSETDSALAAEAEHAVVLAEEAVQALRNLAKDLVLAAGGEGDGDRQRVEEVAYAALDRPYRHWLKTLRPGEDSEDAAEKWRIMSRNIVMGLGQELLSTTGVTAWKGREVNGYLVNVPRAEEKFDNKMNEVFGTRSRGAQDE
ncbi:CRISPR system Cascade subunit CasA [Psychromicrobium silvestre]|uniref:CRISPR system Cascade subunit CasA n=1 Tax=Psychromicrobium silvestre TaxID=1645614 RepID=A0A7Y9LUA6_9MICC|nr:type I-E CRISPR-associated protein Cse1/CasA [Psychromicrobium silvestre]NYE95732.1 CRISPR system Cascade subunit CasA [Psychromicrobium silvestre]